MLVMLFMVHSLATVGATRIRKSTNFMDHGGRSVEVRRESRSGCSLGTCPQVCQQRVKDCTISKLDTTTTGTNTAENCFYHANKGTHV